ncbi:MAG: helix-turn-helix domain-containing protein [Desulfuromonadaceae bacterium]|nr:helix-turn-helix domain-containing protein [Desulfuromonadaceae bacterium]
MSCETVKITLQVMSGKWKPMILWSIHKIPRRFNELTREVSGITPKMLSQQLRELEHEGIIQREVFQTVPPHVEYSMTTYGSTLCPVLEVMAAWGENHTYHQKLNQAKTNETSRSS